MLSAHHTHVVALSVSESTDSAIARIIASDPQGVEKLFRENNVGFGVSQVVVVEMREVATQLVKLLAALVMAEVNVHFAYPLLIRPRGFSAIALHVDDTDCASSVLMGEGFKMLRPGRYLDDRRWLTVLERRISESLSLSVLNRPSIRTPDDVLRSAYTHDHTEETCIPF